jgi:hypothetical protein
MSDARATALNEVIAGLLRVHSHFRNAGGIKCAGRSAA